MPGRTRSRSSVVVGHQLPTRSKLREDYSLRLEGARLGRLRARVFRNVVWVNNRMVVRADPIARNPRDLDGERWYRDLQSAYPEMRAEWDSFRSDGGRLPSMEDVFGGWQGNEGSWWHGAPLMLRGRPLGRTSRDFPAVARALAAVPGLHSAMWSVMGPGGYLPPHTGPNAGGLRLLVGVSCGSGAMLEVAGQRLCLRDGEAVLFDDTALHSSHNDSDGERVLILGDVVRPLRWPFAWCNRLVQEAHHSCIPRFSDAVSRGAVAYDGLNPVRSAAGRDLRA